jgi:hypothetical protein
VRHTAHRHTIDRCAYSFRIDSEALEHAPCLISPRIAWNLLTRAIIIIINSSSNAHVRACVCVVAVMDDG